MKRCMIKCIAKQPASGKTGQKRSANDALAGALARTIAIPAAIMRQHASMKSERGLAFCRSRSKANRLRSGETLCEVSILLPFCLSNLGRQAPADVPESPVSDRLGRVISDGGRCHRERLPSVFVNPDGAG